MDRITYDWATQERLPDVDTETEPMVGQEPIKVKNDKPLAWDVVPAKEPWEEVRISQIIDFLEEGFDREEIAVMIGHDKKDIDTLFSRYPALFNRKPRRSNRLPFRVIDDSNQ